MTDRLFIEDVAGLLGVKRDTVVRWRFRYDDTPEPDGHRGRSPFWTDPDAWTRWAAARPGRGAGGGRPRKPTKGDT